MVDEVDKSTNRVGGFSLALVKSAEACLATSLPILLQLVCNPVGNWKIAYINAVLSILFAFPGRKLLMECFFLICLIMALLFMQKIPFPNLY